MPSLPIADVDLYYEVQGQGPPLLLITGLGFGIWSWFRQRPALNRQFTTIAVENRGVGRSSAPSGAFSIADMADDCAALIRHLDVGPVHALGLSMGGFIAQELVCRHPQLVDRLILACTHPGLGYLVPASAVTVAALMAEANAGWSDEILARHGHLRYSDVCLAERPAFIAEASERRRGHTVARELWDRQVFAALAFTAGARLPGVTAPTLILGGDDDPLVPPANNQVLGALIPGARVVTIPTGRHLFFLEFADSFNQHIIDFLTESRP